MKKVFTGKTKDVYLLDDGNYRLVFKDDMTGTDGVFDPGANTVGLTVEGAGMAGLAMSVYYFKLLEDKGIATQFISSEENTMTVKPIIKFGGGLEVICRYTATGSFIRRYGEYVNEGAPLDAVIEMTLKDDERGDPLINEDALIAIGILKPGEYDEIKTFMKTACNVIKTDIEARGLKLCDIKLEFARDTGGDLILIDEVSGGNMRVKDGDETLDPLDLSKRVIG